MSATGARELDGRRLRRQQNREEVLDALLALWDEGVYDASTAQVAERAGLSPRSLFRYFDDVDDLSRAAISRQQRRALTLLDPGVGPGAPTADKVRGVAEARVRLFESIIPAARAARASAHRNAVVRHELRESRAYLRRQLRRLFSPELAGAAPTVLPALDALCSFETYDLMRTDQGLSRARTISTIAAAMTALLDHSGGRP